MSSLVQHARRAPVVVVGVIVAAWTVVVVGDLTGISGLADHDRLLDASLPAWSILTGLLAGWLVMTAAMMLPVALPVIALFDHMTAGQRGAAAARGAFVGGYVAVWTAFGLAAFGLDAAVHNTVNRAPWLATRPYLVPVLVLILAGVCQFSGLKARCLTMCQHPAAFLLARYRRGTAEAFRLGAGHGMFCVGCCWALMLLTFAIGGLSVLWMLCLTGVVVMERIPSIGGHLLAPIGLLLLLLAGFQFALGLQAS